MNAEKDPKDHFIQPLRTPRSKNGNTARFLVVYDITGGAVTFVYAEDASQGVTALAGFTSNATTKEETWYARRGEEIEVPAKVAKEYLERSRKLALKAIDDATQTITFQRACVTMLPPNNGADGIAQTEIRFAEGERISVTHLEKLDTALPMVAFWYRGFRRMVPSGAVTVSP